MISQPVVDLDHEVLRLPDFVSCCGIAGREGLLATRIGRLGGGAIIGFALCHSCLSLRKLLLPSWLESSITPPNLAQNEDIAVLVGQLRDVAVLVRSREKVRRMFVLKFALVCQSVQRAVMQSLVRTTWELVLSVGPTRTM